MFKERKKQAPPSTPTGKDDAGQQTKRPAPPTIDETIAKADDASLNNDMADLMEESFGDSASEVGSCGCWG